jgi:hypothetical protein
VSTSSPEPPTEVWVHDALVVGPSRVEGRGLVATRHLARGTLLIRLGGCRVSSAELAERIAAAVADPSLPYVDSTSVEDDVHLVLPPGTKAHFANHSCDPNAWHVGPYEIQARRSIAAGEEVTVDYATSSGAPGLRLSCRCGAPNCRRTITSEDWRRPELQSVYRGHWVPAIEARIDSEEPDRSRDEDRPNHTRGP